MNKNLIAKIGTMLVLGYVLFIVIAYVFTNTGFRDYKNHAVLYWEDEKHLGEVFTKESYTNYLASNDGKVNANTFETIGTAWRLTQTISGYSECLANIQGNYNCITAAAADTTSQVAVGCTSTDYQEYLVNNDTTSCDPTNAFYNSLAGSLNATELAKKDNFKSGGLLGIATSLSRETYRQSAYIANVNFFTADAINEIPIVGGNQVNAAGLLWEKGLVDIALGQEFFELWKGVRNLTYYLIIIPTIAFGFAIMFRVQIDNQTQITLMRAIPRLLVVIILITFSYPIIALMVQLAQPVTNVGIEIFRGVTSVLVSPVEPQNVAFEGWGKIGTDSMFGLLKVMGQGLVGIIALAGALIFLVITFIRWVFVSFITVIKIAFMTAFSPLILLFAAFPGRESVIKQFFINMASNIFGLSVLSIMFVASWFLFVAGGVQTNFWMYTFYLFAALGVLWKAPDAPKLLGQMLGAKPLFGGGEDKRR